MFEQIQSLQTEHKVEVPEDNKISFTFIKHRNINWRSHKITNIQYRYKHTQVKGP